ncbi:hypothetical protein CDD81_1314 [Ophiocordyceps australis]|uniref:DBF4-type domain-containing protein n=1 Tax=Ophiocordyceps australis TaxID=1399860 RepID=A0A2C5Y0J1_9HYPO|nr:hypothetical protein CDD81_1314 [Ophiocordyceps australis]
MSPPPRIPLANNPNAANSPLRGQSLLAYVKHKSPSLYNASQEKDGKPPPAKRQALQGATQRRGLSPAKHRLPLAAQRPSVAPAAPFSAHSGHSTARQLAHRERSSRQPSVVRASHDIDNEVWRQHYSAKFPKMVFYFDSIPDDTRAKLTKRIAYFGARQEPFFSIEVTHVITTRVIPCETRGGALDDRQPGTEPATASLKQQLSAEQQPETINPSLLDRSTAARRKLLFDFRQATTASGSVADNAAAAKRIKPRNNDVLHKAREMGKKIWSLDKFQTMLSVLLDTASPSASPRLSTSMRGQLSMSKGLQEPSLIQLLHNERLNGPSDRDPTAVNRELIYFKGPYIYVWDMDERQKPLMVREYPKVVVKSEGEWPQFRSVGNGRCPFVEESETRERQRRRNRASQAARVSAKAPTETCAASKANAAPLQLSTKVAAQRESPPLVKAITGKRTFAEMQDPSRVVPPEADTINPAKAILSKVKFARGETLAQPNHAFISRGEGTRMLAGEPVASGLQPSNITSAIRSQMVSSTSGIHGAKAGTSKEIYGLQRKVLQKAAPAPQDAVSRRLIDVSAEVTSSVSTATGRQTSKTAQDDTTRRVLETKEKQVHPQLVKSKKDAKPGYCENCQEKFNDFDEHIVTRTHRKFAENDDNWADLDQLLTCLRRQPKYSSIIMEQETSYACSSRTMDIGAWFQIEYGGTI